MSETSAPRILHIGKYLPPVPGGIETYLGDILRVSIRHGLEVGAVVHGKRGYPDPNPADFGGAKIYTVPTHRQVLYAPLAPTFPLVLRRAIQEFKPDVLHMHVPNTSAFWALLVSGARRIPWVLHWHADVDVRSMSVVMKLAYLAYRFLEVKLLSKSKVVVATSEDYLAASSALLAWRNKCLVIPLGIDLQRMLKPTTEQKKSAIRFWPKPYEVRLLAVGRLAAYKGYSRLIRALASTQAGSLVIVGGGETSAALRSLVSELGLEDRVRFLGVLSSIEVAACYSAADTFCMASIDRSEAFGLVLLEAAYYRCKIVALNIPGSGVGSVTRRLGGVVMHALSNSAVASLVQPGLATNRHCETSLLPNEFVLSAESIDAWRRCYVMAITA